MLYNEKLKFLIPAEITDHVTSDQSEFREGFGISETVSEVSPKPEIRVGKLQYLKNFGCKLQCKLRKLHVTYIGESWKIYRNN